MAGHADGSRIQQVPDLAQHGGKATGPEQVLHEVPAGRLEVDEQRHARADPIEIVERQRDAEPSGDGEQVDHRIGRAADGRQGHDRVPERTAGHDVAGSPPGADHLDDQTSAELGLLLEAAVGGWDPGRAGEGHPECLGHEAHRGRGAHRVAVAGAPDHRGLRGDEGSRIERPGSDLLALPPDRRPAPEELTLEAAVEHGPARYDQRGQVHRRRGHQQRWDRLVAATEQDDPVDRVGPEEFLGRHRGEVPPEHRGRADLGLAEAHDRHVERHTTGLPDPVRDVPGQVPEVSIARDQVGPGIRDRDVRPAIEGVVGQAPSHPASMDVAVPIRARVPVLTATFAHVRPPMAEGRLPILGGCTGR